ncbi:D-alanyl-D-alanine carboxypeptidase dacF [Waddlia chondrophila 2032/99]|uniref:D-alanyl-D-alanine carboxypeptidase dacF n=2 Tax=Waddlia chondrophila TaxID=71667 RepID=F8LB65_9BACT|nr:D-alanyl-D-alanine carboxypeptidase family protein [Waddlia chondrophila]ADI38868.1 putative D-alanyl-D-alanine carboxypeptidase [Waddlia chondrophila WSU 86-1044]CCB90729.1 D-alanyl-D-alanine carboxypeptidase dacF [Waddlia chondrophila 2032/99]
MNSTFCLIFALLLANSILNGIEIKIHADSAILMNADTGAILYEKNGKKEHFPASLTKIATAIYTLQLREQKLDKMLTAEHEAIASVSEEEMVRSNYSLPAYWLTRGTSHIGIKKGEELSLRDLLYGMMVASGGDASNMIALYMGGTIPVFMEELNLYLKELGCTSTYLMNPHGLHHPRHVSTAYDMAVLTREALKNSTFREIVKTVRCQRPETNKQKATTLIQTNRLLRKGKYYYSKAIGVKTGYTSQAKNNLVAAAKDGDRTLIAVFMHCDDREKMFLDAKQLFNKAFKEEKISRKVFQAGPQKMTLRVEGAAKSIATYIKNDVVFDFYPSEEPKLKCLLKWNAVSLPVQKDQQVGVLVFEDDNGKELHSEALFAKEKVDHHFFRRLRDRITGRKILKFFGACLAVLFIGGLIYELGCVKKSSSG